MILHYGSIQFDGIKWDWNGNGKENENGNGMEWNGME